jgi:hypothetical protein
MIRFLRMASGIFCARHGRLLIGGPRAERHADRRLIAAGSAAFARFVQMHDLDGPRLGKTVLADC